MLFNSLPFLAFFAIFFAAYWALRGWSRLLLCLAASYFFYGWWDVRFVGLIIFSTLLDYWAGAAIHRSNKLWIRRLILSISLIGNLGVLATFKYFDFFADSLKQLADSAGWYLDWPTLNIVLPVGISFYTFQTMSYSIDIYAKRISPEASLLKFATFVAFFPQLVAGPIVRARQFLPQLASDRPFSWESLHSGLGLVLLGFFKKVAVADSIALVADHLFDNPGVYTAVNAAVVIVLYAFQIYCDFSGYSDIATGIARSLGFSFPKNFDFPYFATSFSDFWNRWHISLSSWMRDYVYIPLGGSRFGRWTTFRNLMVTMFLAGLWHGANWTFVVWGLLHGGYLIAQRLCAAWTGTDGEPATNSMQSTGVRTLASQLVRRIVMMSVVFALVCAAWVIFRSPDFGQVALIAQRLIQLDGFSPSTLQDRLPLLKGCLLVTLLVVGEFAVIYKVWHWLDNRIPGARTLSYTGLLWLIALFGTFDGNAFIYFQF